jgi:Lantibiotic dehydratase, N terminus
VTPAFARLADELIALEQRRSDRDATAAEVDDFVKRLDEEAVQAWAAMVERVRDVAASPFVSEAVLWQNRAGWHSGVGRILAGPVKTNSNARKGHLLAIKYLQRYALKNETIGFFGPSCWFDIGDGDGHAEVRAGAGLIADRELFLERWALETIAKALTSAPERKRWLCPVLGPFFDIVDGQLVVPTGHRIPLEPLHAALLSRCDGKTPSQTVAEILAQEIEGTQPEDVIAAVTELASRGWLMVSVPFFANRSPEDALRSWAESITDQEVKREAMQALERLESHRARLRDAAGDAARVDHELEALEATFHELTAQAPTRLQGAAYGGRQLVYEECFRDLSVTTGAAFLDKVSRPLELVLQSAHWFDHTARTAYRSEVREAYERVAARAEGAEVPMAALHLELLQSGLFLPEGTPAPVAKARAAFADKLAELLPLGEPGAAAISFSSADLAARWHEAFAVPADAHRQYICPDLLVMADGPERFEQGDYRVLLGELHLGNTLAGGLAFTWRREHLEALDGWLEADGICETVFPVPPGGSMWGRSHRFSGYVASPFKHAYPLAPDAMLVAGAPRLTAGQLVVVSTDDGLVARVRGGGIEVAVDELLGHLVSRMIGSSFSLYRDVADHPRISIDDLIITRRRWKIPLRDVPVMGKRSTLSRRYMLFRRWQRERGLPRRMFYAFPGELKPWYVDFDSLPLVDNFARSARTASSRQGASASVTVSELLPDLDQLWLPDAEGRCYTSELRVCALPVEAREQA